MASTKLCSLHKNQNKFAIKTTKFEDQVSTCKSTKIISAMQASKIDYLIVLHTVSKTRINLQTKPRL